MCNYIQGMYIRMYTVSLQYSKAQYKFAVLNWFLDVRISACTLVYVCTYVLVLSSFDN